MTASNPVILPCTAYRSAAIDVEVFLAMISVQHV